MPLVIGVEADGAAWRRRNGEQPISTRQHLLGILLLIAKQQLPQFWRDPFHIYQNVP
jgi:hypothetical protein